VQLSVTNFGVAISPETLPHVFEPLVQGTEAAPASQERSKTSLGLGLFIVREIAEGHGGTVAVQSSAETGTRFTMRFPRHGKAH
jgi:signal transduction histidine kinase